MDTSTAASRKICGEEEQKINEALYAENQCVVAKQIDMFMR